MKPFRDGVRGGAQRAGAGDFAAPSLCAVSSLPAAAGAPCFQF